MEVDEVRERFRAAPVARLATVDARGAPHLVPITFALVGGDTIVSAVDHKPKRTTGLRRLANIAANPAVCALVDHYDEDWSQLWWARADGAAEVLGPGDRPSLRAAALDALTARYRPYVERRPAGALIVISVRQWLGWSGA